MKERVDSAAATLLGEAAPSLLSSGFAQTDAARVKEGLDSAERFRSWDGSRLWTWDWALFLLARDRGGWYLTTRRTGLDRIFSELPKKTRHGIP